MTIKDEALAKVNKYRNLLLFVNIPLIFGIPIALESGYLLDSVHSEKVDTTYMLLFMADSFLTFNSFIIYSTLKRVVSGIHYLPEEHKIKIT